MSIFSRSGDLKDFYRQAPVTSVILILNTIMLIAVLLTGGFNTGSIINWGVIRPSAIYDNNEYYRLITGAFLHGSILHYASNMVIGVFVLSSALERIVGSKKFAIIYFGTLILSSVAISLVTQYDTLGASGAIFGVLGSLLYMTIYRKDLLHDRDIQSIWALSALNILMTFLTPGISIIGHVSGIAVGFLISFIVIQRNIFKVLH